MIPSDAIVKVIAAAASVDRALMANFPVRFMPSFSLGAAFTRSSLPRLLHARAISARVPRPVSACDA
jgi:hypothetical protein